MIKLIAIDLDGTLFDGRSRVSSENQEAIRAFRQAGFYPVVSTGRPFAGIPDQVRALPFSYAITCNGGGIYDFNTGEKIFEEAMEPDLILPIMRYIDSKYVHMDAFIDGDAFSSFRCKEIGKGLTHMPKELLHYIIDTRKRVESLEDFILDGAKTVQKVTLNFCPCPDGSFQDRDDVENYLKSLDTVDVVCGGFHNLEFTKRGVNKGIGLEKLSGYLGLSIGETMAIGDTENDFSIIKAAGTGVAMGNSIQMILDASDYVTASNEESGVAKAIYHFCPELRNA